MKRIIDCHCHIYPDKIAHRAVESISRFYGIPMCLDGRCETLLTEGALAGVTHYLIFSVATKPSQTRAINEFIAGEAEAHPGVFTGLGTLHPDSDDLDGDIRHLKKLGLKGVKLHPDTQQFKADDKKCFRMYEKCEGELPVLFHAGDSRFDYSNPNRLRPVLETFGGLTVIAAHFGAWSVWDSAAGELAGFDNLYVDCSSSLYFLTPQKAKKIIQEYGADRVLFGSDFPMWRPCDEIERFYALGLSEDDSEKVLWKNADKLFDIYH